MPRRIPHYEAWYCPDAETYITGIDYYDHPRRCRQRMVELYPFLNLPVPAEDTPVPRPELDLEGKARTRMKRGIAGCAGGRG